MHAKFGISKYSSFREKGRTSLLVKKERKRERERERERERKNKKITNNLRKQREKSPHYFIQQE